MAKKIFAGFVIFVIIAFVMLFQFGGRAAEELTKKLLAEQTALQGTLTAETIKANWSGDVVFTNMTWEAPDGKKLAEIPKATVSVNLFDALLKSGTGASVGDVIMENPNFFVAYSSNNGFDIVNYINYEAVDTETKELVNVKRASTATKFRGFMEIKDANISLSVNDQTLALTKAQVQINFKQYPKVKYSLRIKDSSSDIIADVQSDQIITALNAEVKKMPIKNILTILPATKDLTIDSGIIPDLKIKGEKQDGVWTLNINGSLDEMKGTFVNYGFEKGSGKFSADTNALKISNLAAELSGQKITVDGNVYYATEQEPKQKYDLMLASQSFAINALSPGLMLKDGVTVMGKIKGELDKPEINGTFGFDKMSYDPLYITAFSGKFEYQDSKILIKDAVGSVYAGQIGVNGSVNTKNKEFQLDIHGFGIDSSVVTETQVDGPMSFKLLLVGTEEPSSTTGAGSFRIDAGQYLKSPFYSVRGSLTRQNDMFYFSNVHMITESGNSDGNITVKENGKWSLSL